MGYPDLPIVVIPQAQPTDDRAAFQKRAEEALPVILKALLRPEATVAK